MKKHELLKHAYDNYPKGVKFESTNGIEYTSTANFTCWQEHFNNASHKMSVWRINESGKPQGMVYDGSTKEWAEIVNTKIAVKVENEKEFHALMRYYDSLGWKCQSGDAPLELTYLSTYPFSFENNFCRVNTSDSYQIIPFSDFSKEHNIKLPLIKSEDGFWLYEGDKLFEVNKRNGNTNWYLVDADNGLGYWTVKSNVDKWTLGEKEGFISKAFSSKQSALDWIEAQKPKSKEIKLFGFKIAYVSADKITIDDGKYTFDLFPSDLEDINHALKELS